MIYETIKETMRLRLRCHWKKKMGEYTLFTMVHFRQDRDEYLLGRIAANAGVGDFKSLRSIIEEFKKISMEYF